MKNSLLSIAIVILFLPKPARAFGYAEHCRISDTAFAFALRHPNGTVGPAQRAVSVSLMQQTFTDFCDPKNPLAKLSFGDVAALVDWTLSPVDLYLARVNKDAEQQFATGQLPEDVLRGLKKDLPQLAWASHNNEDHFQDRALFSYERIHTEATARAASGNLVTALVLEAVAVHFLEDALAPGHYLTPRRNLHDLPTRAMHDYHNRRGVDFRLIHAGPLERLATFFHPDVGMLRGAPAWIARLDFATLGQRLGKLTAIRMYGDNLVHQSPDGELLLTLLAASSIYDVLESFRTGSVVPLSRIEGGGPFWKFAGHKKDEAASTSYFLPSLCIPYGCYDSPSAPETLKTDPIYFLSGSGQYFTRSGSPPARASLVLERLLTGSPGRESLGESVSRGTSQYAITLGPRVVLAPSLRSVGPQFRLIKPIRKLDMQFSIIASYSRYSGAAGLRGKWGENYGARFEKGFGAMFVGIGVERDQRFVGTRLERRWVATSSLSLAWPLRFLP